MHDVGFIEVWICLVDFRTITAVTNVVIEVPTHVLVKDGKYGVLLLVCFQLEAKDHFSFLFCISVFFTNYFYVLLLGREVYCFVNINICSRRSSREDKYYYKCYFLKYYFAKNYF